MNMPVGMPMMPPMQLGGGEGVKLVFKNAKITIDRIVLKGKEK
jgi:CO dehydrogenase/acetyl-CoA synthase beta subunit